MAKPTIVTRAGKGSALTWTEGDSNLTNLRDATISIKAGTGGTSVASDLNGEITLVAGTNITLSGDNTAKTVTITASGGGGFDPASPGAIGGTTAAAITGTTITANTAFVGPQAIAAYSTGTLYLTGVSGDTTGNYSPKMLSQINVTNGNSLNTYNLFASNIYGPIGVGGVGTYAGGFTTLTASSTVTLSPADATVTISPTGTGTVTINPATAGSINKINIGASTPGTGAFTTLSASSTVSGTGFSNYLASPPAIGGTTPAAITGTNIIANTQFSGPLNGTVGATTPNTGAFTTLSASSTVSGTGFSNYLASPPAIGGTAASTAVFTDLSSTGKLTFKQPIEAIYDLGTTGGTIAPNATNGSVQKITLNSALTLNAFTSPVAGQSITLIIYGGTSYTSITSTMKFAGGIKTLTATAGCVDIVSIYYDGTNYFASLGKGFA